MALAGMALMAMQAQAGTGGAKMSDTVTRILTEKPLKPSEAQSKYNLAFQEIFLKSKNHFSKLAGKSTGNVKAISLNVVESDQWEWGVDYSYSVSKWQGVENDRVEYGDSHEFIPYGTYFFTSDAYVMVKGGGEYSAVNVRQNAGTLASASYKGINGIFGSEIGFEKDFGFWNPSVNAGILYKNERTGHYTLSDASFNRKEYAHHVSGNLEVDITLNVHEDFQPHVRAAGKTILRRSKNYTIQNWNGWSLSGGLKLFSSKKWNTSLDYDYSYSPRGERESAITLKVAVSF